LILLSNPNVVQRSAHDTTNSPNTTLRSTHDLRQITTIALGLTHDPTKNLGCSDTTCCARLATINEEPKQQREMH